jgi:hypothetical protein
MMWRWLRVLSIAGLLSLLTGDVLCLAAAEHTGRVLFGDLPVPGATVTAVQGDQKKVTVTDEEGVYRFAEIADGVWTVTIEMLGFAALRQDVTIGGQTTPAEFRLQLALFDTLQITSAGSAGSPASAPNAKPGAAQAKPGETQPKPDDTRAQQTQQAQQAQATPASPGEKPAERSGEPGSATGASSNGFARTRLQTLAPAPGTAAATTADTGPATGDVDANAADGFVISGSVNNAANTSFAPLAAFGNNRRAGRALYNGGIGILLGHSALDARPYSFSGARTPKPSYQDTQLVASLAGPLKIPGLITRGPNMFLGYQRTVDNRASAESALIPTALERAGDFSQTRDRLGRPVQVIDPATGLPFAGQRIPSDRLSPQARSLLNYYPLPNVEGEARFNYQAPTLLSSVEHAVQSRLTKNFNGGNDQVYGALAYRHTATDTTSLFNFIDDKRVTGLDTVVNWWHRLSNNLSMRARYQFTRQGTDITPYFANRTNVSGEAGIAGNNQDPLNWGPPRLNFSGGISALGTTDSVWNRNDTHTWGGEVLWNRGRHTITMGGDVRAQRWDVIGQQDPRGSFTFTGDMTGSDLADFMLGLPQATSIAFGNADKYFRAPAYDAYIADDWRVGPTLTINGGVRWEYEAPVTERLDRLVNLDVTPGFGGVNPVLASDPVGALTGQRYPASLMRADRSGIQPRVGLAWRPMPSSSLVIRAGYGIYRNTLVYQPIALLMAQQPPLSTTATVATSAANPLTLANGFLTAASGDPLNTFAVDPAFRVGYAHNWQLLVQRDLPGSFAISASYLGTAGRNLMQELLPNTFPLGAANPCPTCPQGFVYLTSDGQSKKHTGQIQLRRRLRNGFTTTVQYALSKATDDAGAFTGVRLDGSAIAQDWQNPGAEWGPSNFDQRHLLTAQVEHTTGVGGGGMDGLRNRLLEGWTMTSRLTVGSGLPLTPVFLTAVEGTGVIGTIRPNVDASLAGSIADGSFANPDAYTPPAPGQWGNAGRNSIRGPAQFSLDAGIGRSLLFGERYTLDWRLEATNILNRVTYATVNTVVGSPQFGLPVVANPMRKIRLTARLRF